MQRHLNPAQRGFVSVVAKYLGVTESEVKEDTLIGPNHRKIFAEFVKNYANVMHTSHLGIGAGVDVEYVLNQLS